MMRTDPKFLAVARGDEPADLVLRNARIVNVFDRVIEAGDVGLYRDRISSVGVPVDAKEVIDLDGAYLAPGFIDAHMHVESTMLLPSQFVRIAAPHGTTGVVFDPHEIANVLGIPGIQYLMDEAVGLPMHIMFAASSCVPASPLETAGASLERSDLEPLFNDPRVVALAEMMNFPGVINGVQPVLEKVSLGLERRLVDGHCPGLSGAGLQAYVAAGISSDHECTTAEEAREKLRLGMQVYLREGSAAKNLESLVPVVNESNAHRFCFCTDDRHPGDLIEEGHIDHVVRKAIQLGIRPITALAMASLHVANHYGQPDLGAVAPGRFASLIVFDSLDEPNPRLVYHAGQCVASDGCFIGGEPQRANVHEPAGLRETVHLPADFDVSALNIHSITETTSVRVIGMNPHQLLTEHRIMPATIWNGTHVANTERDVLPIAVIERHSGTGNVGLGLVQGFGIQHGALASTVGHDSHNITTVGTSAADMHAAACALADAGGGQCVVRDGEVLALLPLPIAGLLSSDLPETVAQCQRLLHEASRAIGCQLADPFMPLSFLPLTVIPHLKLSDRGLVDVDAFDFVSLEVDESHESG